MPKTLAIFNPSAARGRAAHEFKAVRNALQAAGLQVDIVETRASLHAVRLAWQAPLDGYERIVAIGGDGIAHEIINGLLRASKEGPTIPLGILPLGSGNDFIKSLPPALDPGQRRDDWHAAIMRLLRGQTAMVDVGRISADAPASGHPHPHYFINAMDVGFGARVAFAVRHLPSFLTGTLLYGAGVLRVLTNYQIPRLKLTLDGTTELESPSVMTAVANGRCLASAFWIAPHASVDDGQFDVVVGAALGRLGILGLVPALMQGTHLGHPAVRTFRARHIRIESPDPLTVEADGEIPFSEAHRLEITNLPRRLCVIV